MDIAPILASYGLPGVIIFVLGGVVLYQNKKYDKLQDKYDALQEKRYIESQADKEKLSEPLKEQTKLSERIYDLLVSGSRGQ